ncbi:hypothetical protein [Streptomyces sp. NBC_00459]
MTPRTLKFTAVDADPNISSVAAMACYQAVEKETGGERGDREFARPGK